MEEKNPSIMPGQQQGLDTLQDIRRMMQRSSRFISLSGLSGVAAGICALIGCWIAGQWLGSYYQHYDERGSFSNPSFEALRLKLLVLALIVLGAAWVTAFYFTWRKARHDKLPVWDISSRRLTMNMLFTLSVGGFFILTLLQYGEWRFVAPGCLVFYGIALVNASRYTLGEIRYLGIMQVALGLVSMQFVGYGLYFWAAGFGALHIIYGLLMWWKYERKTS